MYTSDIVPEVQQEITAAYNNQDRKAVTNNIDGLIRQLNGEDGKFFDQFGIDELSKTGGNLAILRASLIQQKMEAYRNVRIEKEIANVKRAGDREKIKRAFSSTAKMNGEKPPTVDDIATELDRQMAKQNLLVAMHEAEYERLQNYWYAIPDILYRIETRINILKGDRSTTKFISDDRVLEIPEIGRQEIKQPTGVVDVIKAMESTEKAAPIGG